LKCDARIRVSQRIIRERECGVVRIWYSGVVWRSCLSLQSSLNADPCFKPILSTNMVIGSTYISFLRTETASGLGLVDIFISITPSHFIRTRPILFILASISMLWPQPTCTRPQLPSTRIHQRTEPLIRHNTALQLPIPLQIRRCA
jgi:hypothetical protein